MRKVSTSLRAISRAASVGVRAAGHSLLSDYVLHGCRREFQIDYEYVDTIPGWLRHPNAAAMYAVIRDLRPTVAVEIGSYMGRSTVLIASALRRFGPAGSFLTAIDPHTGDRQQLAATRTEVLPTAALFHKHVAASDAGHLVHPVIATSDEAFKGWRRSIDFLYVDGWHSYGAVHTDTTNWGSYISPTGVVCFDDYVAYEEVQRGIDDACRELGLTFYGVVAGQAWAGRRRRAVPALQRGLKVSGMKQYLAVPPRS